VGTHLGRAFGRVAPQRALTATSRFLGQRLRRLVPGEETRSEDTMRSTDIIFVPLLAIASAVALGCQRDDADKPAETGTKTSVGEEAKAGGATAQLTANGREFILTAAKHGTIEVQASRLAESKAQTDSVKELARMIVEHHTRANDELAKLAKGFALELPMTLDASAQDELDDLRKATGREFDEAYVDLVIDEHERAVRLFEGQAKNDDDPAVRAWASQMLPTLRSHLDLGKTTKDSLDETPPAAVPPAGGSPSGTQPSGAGTPDAGAAGDTKTGDTKTGDTKTGDTKTGDTKTGDTKTGDTKRPPDASPAPGGR
jgi:putative membrane protein